MKIQHLKNYLILAFFVAFNLCPLMLFSVVETKPLFVFKILNYKKKYRDKEYIFLTVKNESGKPMKILIGAEAKYDDKWIEFNPDIENAGYSGERGFQFTLIKPNQSRNIKITPEMLSYPPPLKHGISKPTRFVLYYADIDKLLTGDEKRIVSYEFIEIW
jgi:hypothetical protein